jgi:drug/metabolite transporter (DMT)-like permease
MSLTSASPALAAALLVGASTPAAKVLVGNVPPLLLAGLLYLGSGLGLAAVLVIRSILPGARRRAAPASIPLADWPWLAAAVVAGGLVGPVLLMLGLARTDAAAASLLLNLEGVLTALIAWVVFRENADRRVVLGMLAIVAGGALLAWEPGGSVASPGALLVVAACLCWAVDNNLTRRVSTHDAVLVACVKGLVAGAGNTALAVATGATLPGSTVVLSAALVGFLGYGVSLALFVVGLRTLGTARAGAYFSVAPLFGVAVSLLVWPERPGVAFWLAAALMAAGVWLHVRERHEHLHAHEPLTEPHAHRHRHEVLVHRHPHYPDIHHRHDH